MPRGDPFAPKRTYTDPDIDQDAIVASDGIKQVEKPRKPATELTDVVAQKFISLVEEGMMIPDAAKYMMIPTATIQSWYRYAMKEPTSRYAWFVAQVEQAQAVFMHEMVKNVRTNARRDGHVALKALEKAASGTWRPATQNIDVKGEVIHKHVGTELARLVEKRKQLQAGTPAETVIDGEIVGEEEVL